MKLIFWLIYGKSIHYTVSEYKEEQRFITEVGALFGTFLKHNSIITYNDAIKAYVELSITEARKHAEFTGNFDRVNALEQCLREYIEHKTILERCIQDGSGQCISPEEVKRYYFELMALKLCGEDIRQFFEQEEKAQKEQVWGRGNTTCINGKGAPPPLLSLYVSWKKFGFFLILCWPVKFFWFLKILKRIESVLNQFYIRKYYACSKIFGNRLISTGFVLLTF